MMSSRIILALVLAVTVSMATAQTHTKATKKETSVKTKDVKGKKKGKEAAVAEAAKPDTVSLSEFSYDMGVTQVGGLKTYLAQRMGVDTVNNMSDFLRGLKEVLRDPDDKSIVAYSAGMQIGAQVAKQFLEQLNQQITGEKDKAFIDVEQYKKGFLAGISGEGLAITVDSASAVTGRQMKFYQDRLMEEKYGENRRAGEEWLAQNAKQPGVKTLPSGVQYKVIEQGTGEKPTASSTVKVNYEGKLIDGTVFDSSYKRNQAMTFKCSQVIKGWSEAIQQMPVGSTWEIYIPQELGYGSREAGQIKPFSTLIFKVELLGIEPEVISAK